MKATKPQRKHLQKLLDRTENREGHKFLKDLEIVFNESKTKFKIRNTKQHLFVTHSMEFEDMIHYLNGFERALEFVYFEKKRKNEKSNNS